MMIFQWSYQITHIVKGKKYKAGLITTLNNI